jgi:type IV secretory pathway VirB4 component
MITNKKKQPVEQDRIPATVEDTIPIQKIYEDGIMLVGRNLWAKTFRFTDINYEVASKEDKERMFFDYSEILNLFDEKASTKITIRNRHIPRSEFEAENMLPLAGDELDRYRREYNSILERNVILTSGVEQDKYLTITVEKPSIEEARTYFNGKEAEFKPAFAKLGSKLTEVDEKEKIRIFFDFFHRGCEEDFMYDRLLYKRRKHKFKLALAPESMEFKSDYFKMDGRYGRVLYLKDYANFIKDSLISELTAIDRNMMLSIDAEPMPQEKAVRQGESKLLAVETNISNWQRKQNQNNNFSATVPYEMERQRDESRDFLNDLVERDMRMIPTLITIVHTAETKAQLDADTESIMQCARKHLCSLSILRWQQLEGLKTCLPYGGTKLTIRRTLTTESLAVFMPFRAQEVCHKNGLYLGNNAISKNMIMVNRLELLNGNSFITGVSGSGKSIMAKQEIVNLYLSDKNADIIVIDPEREYLKLTEALGGENIVLSSTSKNHINALQINKDYADGANPITLKSEFVLTLFEQILNGGISMQEKTIIDRCTGIVLRDYVQNDYTGAAPTLKDFREVLLRQSEPEAADIALAIELFTEGSLNTFAKQTNVDTEKRLICYDIHNLGRTLTPIGMLVLLDNILNRITENRAKGRKTYIFIDEIYLLFQHPYSAEFLFKLWKRVRKYGAFITGITQNVDDLLQSHTARTMLANSELVVMLNQAATDRADLAELFNMSELQLSYITNAEAGHGLAKIGGALVPFQNRLPKDTQLYRLMTTKFGE